jgi:predicted GNAT family acetyltransferase
MRASRYFWDDEPVSDSAETEDRISLAHVPERQRYELRDDGALIGRIDYRRVGDEQVDLLHTEVDEAYGGRGLAGRLVAYAIADIRSRDERIIPHCPYVQSWLRKHPGYNDAVDWPHGA